MREILFRGKRKDNGEWVEGYYLYRGEEHSKIGTDVHYIIPHDMCGFSWWEVIPETVGQFTGMADKNGKRIFEGDLFLMDDEIIAVVIFKDGCFRLELHGLCGAWTESGFDECGGGYGIIECDPIDWYYIRDMEVIGNIHDNPELIAGERAENDRR